MSILSLETVCLQATAGTKTAAIIQAGELLVQHDYVTTSYIEGMLAREQLMSTYLGNGVAIPHGTFDYLPAVRRTGIAVVQLPAGVEWEAGERVYLVIGIAATADEHLGVLANLAEIVENPEMVELLAHTSDPSVILEMLDRSQPVES